MSTPAQKDYEEYLDIDIASSIKSPERNIDIHA